MTETVPTLKASDTIAKPIVEGLAYMTFMRDKIGDPVKPGFLRDFLENVQDAARRAGRDRRPRTRSSAPRGSTSAYARGPWAPWGRGQFARPPWCPEKVSIGKNFFETVFAKPIDALLPGASAVVDWFNEDSSRGRIVGGWAARVGAVVVSAVATYYTGGATTPLLVSSLNVLMTDPATTTWDEDVTAFMMAGQVLDPTQRPPELEKYAEITGQVNENLWDLPAAQRDEIIAKGEARLMAMAEAQGPEAAETMRQAIAEYKARGIAGAYAKGSTPTATVAPWYVTYKNEIGLGLVMAAALGLGATIFWWE
ncbi:MAG: hypothetical protein ABIJ57_01870 [Pseudomonadota bacterium]